MKFYTFLYSSVDGSFRLFFQVLLSVDCAFLLNLQLPYTSLAPTRHSLGQPAELPGQHNYGLVRDFPSQQSGSRCLQHSLELGETRTGGHWGQWDREGPPELAVV